MVIYKLNGFGGSSFDEIISWGVVALVKPNYFSFDVFWEIVGGSSGDFDEFGWMISIKWFG